MYNLALSEEPSDKVMVNLPHNELLKDEYNKIEYVFGFGVIELAKKVTHLQHLKKYITMWY